jgi:hypothetical protein
MLTSEKASGEKGSPSLILSVNLKFFSPPLGVEGCEINGETVALRSEAENSFGAGGTENIFKIN